MALAQQQTTPADNQDMLITFNVEEIKTLIAQSLKRASGFDDHSGASRFSTMFRDMKSEDPGRQIMASSADF